VYIMTTSFPVCYGSFLSGSLKKTPILYIALSPMRKVTREWIEVARRNRRKYL
jgi:hypothetical protein